MPSSSQTHKIFLASSQELAADRKDFEIFISRKNADWVAKGVFLELVIWESFLDVMSRTRLQDEYNRAIKECSLFVMLYCTKVGPYTEEEFNTAFGEFQAQNRPFILTYFKDAPAARNKASDADKRSLADFQARLKSLGHYQTVYRNVEGLQLHFSQQLDKLAADGFIRFQPEQVAPSNLTQYQASLNGNGAIAQGPGAVAVGAGGVMIGGNNSGVINTGSQFVFNGGKASR